MDNLTDLKRMVEEAEGLHDKLAASHPRLSRGQVWCRRCGSTQRVNTPGAMRYGWPKCCGHTMTIDSPAEQAALNNGGG